MGKLIFEVESYFLSLYGITLDIAEFMGIPEQNIAKIKSREEYAGCYGLLEELLQNKQKFLDPDLRVVRVHKCDSFKDRFKVEIKLESYKQNCYCYNRASFK